jgi:hypothetical protein
MSSENHDKLFEAFQEYCKAQNKFEWDNVDEAGLKARYWLSEIRKFAKLRRQEIMDKRAKLKKLRNGRNGRPPKIHNE